MRIEAHRTSINPRRDTLVLVVVRQCGGFLLRVIYAVASFCCLTRAPSHPADAVLEFFFSHPGVGPVLYIYTHRTAATRSFQRPLSGIETRVAHTQALTVVRVRSRQDVRIAWAARTHASTRLRPRRLAACELRRNWLVKPVP